MKREEPTPLQKDDSSQKESNVRREEPGGSKVAQLRSMFESKPPANNNNIPKYDTSKYSVSKQPKKEDDIHIHRAKAISSLF